MGLTRLIPRPALVRFQMAVLSLRAPVAVLAFAWAVYQVWIGVTAPLSVPDSHWGDHTRAWPPEGYQYETRQISGDLEMKLVAGGPKNGSKGLVLLLHGFPLTSAQWSGYLEHFVSDGYRTLAPDLRLVNDSLPQDSQTPPTWDQLVADIENLIATEGPAAAHGAILVTHDWGAALGWAFALRRPDLTRSFVTMNIPHLVLYRKRAISMLRWTWYVMYQGLTRHFALWRAKKDDFAWVEWFWLATSRSGVFGRPEIEALKDVWRKGSLGTFMLWYTMASHWVIDSYTSSHAFLGSAWESTPVPVQVPTLQIFAAGETCYNPAIMAEAASAVYLGHVCSETRIFDGSHWLPLERRADILRTIDSFLEHCAA